MNEPPTATGASFSADGRWIVFDSDAALNPHVHQAMTRLVTPAWEGGHMDHDMCALLASRIAQARGKSPAEATLAAEVDALPAPAPPPTPTPAPSPAAASRPPLTATGGRSPSCAIARNIAAANCGLLCKVSASGTLHLVRRAAYTSVDHASGRNNRLSTRAYPWREAYPAHTPT